jgi:ABC-2 type transport system ATP-binding protein
MSIKIQNVTKEFGEQIAVNDISLQIRKGEIVGFLGPNGAGKSTTMKMITGFLSPNKGTIEVCGLNLLDNEMDYKSKIGYLPESNPLYYEMYVREYLKFCSQIYKIKNASERIELMIEMTGLTPEAHKKIGALSKD